MKKGKLLTSIAMTLAGVGAITSLSGCGKDKKKEEVSGTFAFSIALASGKNQLEKNATDQIVVYNNGVNVGSRSYKYYSTKPDLATVDENTGAVKVKGDSGSVNFYVVEANSPNPAELVRPVTLVGENASNASGGFNFANSSGDAALEKRAEILGKLEKYTMDSHLTGITLFDNGGYVRYNKRVKIPASEYVTGYGFGILTEGELTGPLLKPDGSGQKGEQADIYPMYLHSAIAQDSLKINQYTATGSQVSDLASYITSSYWGTKLDGQTKYKWYPVLATDKIYETKFEGGKVNIDKSKTVENSAPIPMEEKNGLDMYKKWRIYVKTDGDKNSSVLKFHQNIVGSDGKLAKGPYDGRSVTIEDYVFPYKMLLTGSNAVIRGTEMANDSSYGIKGAARYFSDTKSITNEAQIDDKWNQAVNGNKLGIHYGSDDNGYYLDLELINAIDSFTAMYTLSSSLVSPLPREMFMGANAIIPNNFKKSATAYGTFNNGDHNDILKYTVSCGPYTLEKWVKNESVVFKRNNDWFEVGEGRYKIEGVYNRVIDVSQDTEKNWKQFEEGNLDSAGVPTKKVAEWKGQDGVKETKGDSTFKLNVNSCTQTQWDEKFGPNGTVSPNGKWNIKPWMSNSNFLDGLFYSINRKQFAEKRGVTPSINYFSDSYMANPEKGISYNSTQAHKDAVKGYETIDKNGNSDYGYSYDKALSCFRNAVQELSKPGKGIVLGTKDNPTEIHIHIRWMYQTDIKEYGEDIKYYFETAFNDEAVCGGKVKLVVDQDAVTNWEDVYNEWMMKGQFDLGFGAISGNSFNPLNFMEVLKSDNSSSFTLNWGADTGKIDPINPIYYDDNPNDDIPAKKWSFDGLWEVADHGGVLNNGATVKPIERVKLGKDNFKKDGVNTQDLNNGFDLTLPVEFIKFDDASTNVSFDVNRVDCYVYGKDNTTLGEKGSVELPLDYNASKGIVTIHVSQALANEIRDKIINVNGWDKEGAKLEEWQKAPFLRGRYGQLFDFEVYYSINISGSESESFITATL